MTTQDIAGLVEQLRKIERDAGSIKNRTYYISAEGDTTFAEIHESAQKAASALEHLAGENARLREVIKSYVDPITYEDILARAALGDTPAGLDKKENDNGG